VKGRLADRVMRVVVIGAAAGLVALVGLRVAELLDDPPKPELAALRSDETSVADALRRAPAGTIIVRGYVFAGDGFPVRVCSGILRESPPKCVGPFLELRNLDPSRVPVRQQGSVIWSPETVGFLGQVDRDRLVVQELLN
jgi:hypothetical protein